VAGTAYPGHFDGAPLKPLPGQSLLSAFRGNHVERNRPLFFEHSGRKAVITNRQKLVLFEPEEWELYDSELDRIESNNLMSEESPDRIAELLLTYHQWAHETGVFPKSIVNERVIRFEN